jgi:hypothetical protein
MLTSFVFYPEGYGQQDIEGGVLYLLATAALTLSAKVSIHAYLNSFYSLTKTQPISITACIAYSNLWFGNFER